MSRTYTDRHLFWRLSNHLVKLKKCVYNSVAKSYNCIRSINLAITPLFQFCCYVELFFYLFFLWLQCRKRGWAPNGSPSIIKESNWTTRWFWFHLKVTAVFRSKLQDRRQTEHTFTSSLQTMTEYFSLNNSIK